MRMDDATPTTKLESFPTLPYLLSYIIKVLLLFIYNIYKWKFNLLLFIIHRETKVVDCTEK